MRIVPLFIQSQAVLRISGRLALIITLLVACLAQAADPGYAWMNFAGLGRYGHADGSAGRFYEPAGVAVDKNGNVYVADTMNCTIRKVTPAGVVTTLAGSPRNSGYVDGSGSAARFYSPSALTVDKDGIIYVADTFNHVIRKVTATGVVTTFAGIPRPNEQFGGFADGAATVAMFNQPFGITLDVAGNLYVADTANCAIRKITSAGIVTTLAGSPPPVNGVPGFADGTGSAAQFNRPIGVTVDASGIVYVTDSENNCIRRVTASGVVTTLAGMAGTFGTTDGTGSAARFYNPWGIAVNSAGNLIVANHFDPSIRQVTTEGVVTTLAGNGEQANADGIGGDARFISPSSVVASGDGSVYVADAGSDAIRKVTGAGVVTTFAGSSSFGASDGIGSAARFSIPHGLAVDANGKIYVADSYNRTIRKITPAGVVTTLAGKAGISGFADGPKADARFGYPTSVAVDKNGNLYVSDGGNNTIRAVTSSGVVTTLAGNPEMGGGADGTGLAAQFRSPGGVALDSNGILYVSDSGNHTIRKVTPAGVVTTLAGSAEMEGAVDGMGAAARFSSPQGLAVDLSGNIYVADYANQAIRKVSPDGVVTTLAGELGRGGASDGIGSAAHFSYPVGVAVDRNGNVFVADNYNTLIRRISPAGVVTTIGGAGFIGSADGIGSAAQFGNPIGIAISSSNLLYVADDNRIALGGPAGMLPQFITFPPIGSRSTGDVPFTLKASSTSGLPIAFSVFSGPATLSGSTLTLTGSGTVTVLAQCSGSGYLPADPVFQTFQVLGATAQFQGIGLLQSGSPTSSALGISNGGTVVAGSANDGNAALWSRTAGLQAIANTGGSAPASSNAVSADGYSVVGAGNGSGTAMPFLASVKRSLPGTAIASVDYLGALPGLAFGSAQAVSADGSVVAGYSSSTVLARDAVAGAQAFQWSDLKGMLPLGSLIFGGASRADGISGDGSIIVGTSESPFGGSSIEAFRWTQATGIQGLGALPGGGFISRAKAVSADGSTIIGTSVSASHLQACYWLPGDSNPRTLPELAGATASAAHSVCGDGNLITGYNVVSGTSVAVIWQRSGPVYTVKSVANLLATQYTLDSASASTLTGWTLIDATAISPDGFAIAGNGINPSGRLEAWLAIVPRPSVVSVLNPAPVSQGAASVAVTLSKSNGIATDVTFQIIAGSAIQVVNGVGDYDASNLLNSSASNTPKVTVHFDAADAVQTITVPLNFNGAPAPSGRSFTLAISSPANGATIGSGTATIQLNGALADPNGPFEPQISPGTPPGGGALRVVLLNNGTLGWRLPGETEAVWRSSGDIISNLPAGEYVIEFESKADFSTVPPTLIPAPAPIAAIVTAGVTSPITIAYPAISPSETGSLQVIIVPNSVAQFPAPEMRGRWRFIGEGEAMWRDGGATILGLPAGTYALEFQPVSGQTPVPARTVLISSGQLMRVSAEYQPKETVTGALPATLPLSRVSGEAPFKFIGQITTQIGRGTGVAVTERVVLTAAHVIFEDSTLSFATEARWQYQKYQGQQEPVPLLPRGAYLLSGYAAARVGAVIGEGTPLSQNLDAAALYFVQPAANGGSSGYLVSNASSEWLLKPRLKVLAGYAIDESYVAPANVGQMQATPIQLVNFLNRDGFPKAVYKSAQIAGLAGMSGGPLCVQYDDGNFYPAGIYLGGNQQCLVRGIDEALDGLIQSAVASGLDGKNHVGGGQVQVSTSLTAARFQLTTLTINFPSNPPGAGWRLATEAASALHTDGNPVDVPSGLLTLVFAPVKGLTAPANLTVNIAQNQRLVLNAQYVEPKKPAITTTMLPPGGLGLAYSARISASFSPGTFSGTLADPFKAETSLGGANPLQLKLDNKGALTGLIPANAAIGEYKLTVSASNAVGSDTRTFQLLVSAAGELNVTCDPTRGSFSPAAPQKVPIGQRLTFTAQPNSAAFVFDSWTELVPGASQPAILTRSATYSFIMPASLSLVANFIPNPYPSVAGSYNGLLTAPGTTVGARGLLSAKVNPAGVFTGTFSLGVQRYAMRGVLDHQGAFIGLLKGQHGRGDVTINLLLDFNTQKLAGAVTTSGSTGVTFALAANRAAFSSKAPAPQALGQKTARYTLALPHSATPTVPQGDGFGTVTVTSAGVVRFIGTLGDGAAASAGSSLGKNGEWPLYILPAAYHGIGVLTGPLSISAPPSSSISGSLDWLKSEDKPSAISYPAGFAMSAAQGNAISVIGAPLAPLLPLEFVLRIGKGVQAQPVALLTVTVNSKTNAGTGSGVTGFKIVPGTGVFSGKFFDPNAPARVRPFKGAYIAPKASTVSFGYGYFLDEAQRTGFVEF